MSELGSSVRVANADAPIRAKFTMVPQLSFPAEVCDWRNGLRCAMFVAPLKEIVRYLVAPVHSYAPGRLLAQTILNGWDRVLQPWGSLDIPIPVIVSGRTNWLVSGSSLEIFAEAYVLDGACRLESMLSAESRGDIAVAAVMGLSENDEVDIRRDLFQQAAAVEQPAQPKCGTDTPRVKISVAWMTLTFTSEPFVVPTSRGYAPAVLVKRKGAIQQEHILIGARSLAEPIEALRLSRGFLEGLTVRIHKSSDDATAPYEVMIV